MKKSFYLLLISAMVIATLAAFSFSKKGEVRHIVVFKYKASATPEQIEEVTTAFRDLKDKIPGIVSFEHGVNNSPEKLNKGFTHVYLLTLKALLRAMLTFPIRNTGNLAHCWEDLAYWRSHLSLITKYSRTNSWFGKKSCNECSVLRRGPVKGL